MSFKPLYFERNSTRSLGLADFSTRVESFFHYLGEQDYFPDIGYGTTPIDVSTLFYHETKFRLGFDPFPISNGEFTDNEQLFSFI